MDIEQCGDGERDVYIHRRLEGIEGIDSVNSMRSVAQCRVGDSGRTHMESRSRGAYKFISRE